MSKKLKLLNLLESIFKGETKVKLCELVTNEETGESALEISTEDETICFGVDENEEGESGVFHAVKHPVDLESLCNYFANSDSRSVVPA